MENIETLLAAVAQTQGFDDDEPEREPEPEPEPVVSTEPVPRLETSPEIPGDVGGSQVVVASPEVNRPPETAIPETNQVIGAAVKRKRGRPPKGQLAAKPPPPKRKKEEDEDEDVCFICFDGGSLVLCDRRGCPKAYHPACIKRDEAFFRSKAKWNCGWHICSVCLKASHYMCYTCTYSLCKGCTKDADYVCVRGNKGFCTTCMKTIMLIENKDQADNPSAVQVDFDDITSWEYLFKMYWVLLKEKLSLSMSELTQARKPWKGVTPVVCKPQLSNVHYSVLDGKVSIPNRSSEHLEINKLQEAQNDRLTAATSIIDNHIGKPNSIKGEYEPTFSKDTKNGITNEPSIDEKDIQKATDNPVTEQDADNPSIVKDKGESSDRDPEDSGIDIHTEWASKSPLEFIAHMKSGDASTLSQFDVQSLLLDYIKRNNLGDPVQKTQIVCDLILKNLFGEPQVDHTEMLKLLKSHFLINEDSQKDSLIPAGFAGSVASGTEVDGNNVLMQTDSRKRKIFIKSEEREPQNNSTHYAAIDLHNINMIYLRRNMMENLIEDKENFHDKVVGSIVRIRISSDDQKPDVYRLVKVVGTSKVAEPYKVGDRTADVMLEVLNLGTKEVVSIDAISNQEFTEDECRQFHQSIKCGLLKQFTTDEVKKKAMALQAVRLNDWLEAEILRLNHFCGQASEKGRKKELREYAHKILLLKSPEEYQRRIAEVPEIHADLDTSPDYESVDARNDNNNRKDEHVRQRSSASPRVKKFISSKKKDKKAKSILAHDRMIEKVDASGSDSLQEQMDQVKVTKSAIGDKNDQAVLRSESGTPDVSVGNSLPANIIETEKLWHYRDSNGKIQGPFSMMHLRHSSTTGLFPPDMRIWTNHEQYDSLLLTDALNGRFHGASEWRHGISSESEEHRASESIGGSNAMNKNGGESKQKEAECTNNESSDNNSGSGRANDSSWPQCWDLLKDNNSSANNVPARSLLPSSSLGQMFVALRDCDDNRETDEFNHVPETNSNEPTQNWKTSEPEPQNQSTYQNKAGQSSLENLRALPIDLSLNDIDAGPVSAPVSKPPDSVKQDPDIDISDLLPSPIPKTRTKQWDLETAEKQQSGFLELLSPAPRSINDNDEGQVTETKQPGLSNFPVPNSGPGWGGASNLMVGGIRLPEVADDWCEYSPTPAKPCVEGWDPDLVSAPPLKPHEITNTNVATSDNNQLTHLSPSHPASNMPSWLAMLNEPIEFDALGEESVSDLLAEVDAMESQGVLPSPTSAMKQFTRDMQDCKDDCFSSIEEFSPPAPGKSDALSSTSEIHLSCQSSMPCKPVGPSLIDALDSFSKSDMHSSGSSAGENNAPLYPTETGSEFHRPAPNNMSQDLVGATMALGMGSETIDPGWGTVQGNINLVTVQGNVNLVLGGPAQGMTNLGWGTNQTTAWGPNPNVNQSPINGSLPWDGQRKYNGERFSSPREWGYQGGDPGFGRGRPPWGRSPYGGGGSGGYSRPLPKGQRVCKFYESGRCKKGAFCDYLHP